MQLNKPKITVYITNYNYGKYIKKAIESVLIQTETDNEIIIIDDGSNDDSKSIIETYRNHKNIKIVMQQNKGLTVSNNLALKLSRGKYIMRLDADDYLTKDALKNLASVLDRKTNVGMVFGDYYLIDEQNNILEHFQRHDFNNDVELLDQPAHGACTMFRTRCLKQLGGYDESISRQDGYELWLRFIERYEVSNISVPIFYYRQHGRNLTLKEDVLLDTRTEILSNHLKKKGRSQPKGIAILPIRGTTFDNRSLPFSKVGDKTLIANTIEFLFGLSTIDIVILTCPEKKVIDYANDIWGEKISIIQRPKNLAYINSPLEPVIEHALANTNINRDYDFFMISSIELPFKKAKIMESGANIMKIFGADTVVGVRPEEDLLLNHNGKGMQFLSKQGQFRLERNELFKMVPGYLIRDYNSFLISRKLFGNTIGHVMFDELSAFRIKNDLDCEIANFLLDKIK